MSQNDNAVSRNDARPQSLLELAGPALLEERLPCAVKVAPATVIRKGCTMRTLLTALEARREVLAQGVPSNLLEL